PLGLVEFCFDTGSTDNTVSLTFVTDLEPSQVKARKYNSTNNTYFDIQDATITKTTHQGQPALVLSYTITDNGILDLDTTLGSIKDPVGLAITNDLASQLANTGTDNMLYIAIGSITALALGGVVWLRQKRGYFRYEV
ncbi:LPXTG cell wall anchor domain-containing protein, partial [Candidatus Saccharibacteria bacterium]|nr:LPXTG cell wall anchor domain-containing protein [Candidatus Saccharibacteria bacterium]